MLSRLLLQFAAAPVPDILPPGHKGVSHELILEWGDDVGSQRFIAYPTRGFHVPHEIDRGRPFSFSSKYRTRIYAIPTDAEFPTEREQALEVPWPNAAVPVGEIRSIAAGNPLARAETTVRVLRVTEDDIEFGPPSTVRFDGSGAVIGRFEWLPLLVIALLGAAMTLHLSRRRRKPPAEAADEA